MMLIPPDSSISIILLVWRAMHDERTHLLGNHDNARGLRSPSDARDSEEFVAPCEEVVPLRQAFLFLQLVLKV